MYFNNVSILMKLYDGYTISWQSGACYHGDNRLLICEDLVLRPWGIIEEQPSYR